MADWSSLTRDIVRKIMERIATVEDYLVFGAVCREWHLMTEEYKSAKISTLPWCMLGEVDERCGGDANVRPFYSFSRDKVFSLYLPEIKGRRCWGTPHGWLITHGEDLRIQLFNPLSRVSLPLPSQRTFPQHQYYTDPLFSRPYYLHKAVLLPIPGDSLSDWVVVAIYSPQMKLGFARPGDCVWSPVLCRDFGSFSDVVCINGTLYACGFVGDVWTLDLCTASSATARSEAVKLASQPPIEIDARNDETMNYLVDIGGELCLIARFMTIVDDGDEDEEFNNPDEDYIVFEMPDLNIYQQIAKRRKVYTTRYYRTKEFAVFKLDLGTKKWTTMVALGNWCLFVGQNQAMSVDTSKHPEFSPNCIYYSEDYGNSVYPWCPGFFDMGRFDVLNGTNVRLIPVPRDSYSHICPPLWITPSLH